MRWRFWEKHEPELDDEGPGPGMELTPVLKHDDDGVFIGLEHKDCGGKCGVAFAKLDPRDAVSFAVAVLKQAHDVDPNLFQMQAIEMPPTDKASVN